MTGAPRAPAVLYDYDVFNRQRFGGITRYFVELVRHMPPELAICHIFSGFHINEMLDGESPATGVRVPAWGKTASFREWVNQQWLQFHVRSSPPDVFHKTLYCRQEPPKKSKLIITLHDLTTAHFPDLFGGKDPDSPIKRYWAERADAILAVSETTKRDAIEILGVSPAKITVTRLGIHQQEPTALQRSTSPHPRPYLLYVGTRYKYKNFGNLVRAYARSEGVRSGFDLICFGGGEFSGEERSFLLDCGAADRVHFRSGDDSLLLHHYLHARGLVFPSRYEGFGLPLLEAMKAGCPVLCSDIPTTREVAGNAAAYFASFEAEAISADLETFVFNDGLLAQKAALGRERVKEFSWRRCAAETAAVYRSVV